MRIKKINPIARGADYHEKPSNYRWQTASDQ